MSDQPRTATGEELNALATIVEQIAGVSWDLATEGRPRHVVVAAALASLGRMVNTAEQPRD